MKTKWSGDDESKKTVDLTGFTGGNGTLNVVTVSTDVPFSYIKYGYGIDIRILDFGGMIPGLVQGMYDFVLNDAVITEERMESVYFSDPYNYANVHLIIRKADAVGSGSDTASVQAAVRFIPVYKQEIVSLLKSTSIVGYIAIQDLTEMSDIIRSRTYEAFFPLIATAMICFILAWIISLIIGITLKCSDRRRRKGAAAG